jgi:hypothetical protein
MYDVIVVGVSHRYKISHYYNHNTFADESCILQDGAILYHTWQVMLVHTAGM